MESKNEILDAATLHVRAVSAAVRYLEGKGYTVIERDFITEIGSFDIIAADDTEESALVFVSVNETYDEDFAESLPNRETCERLAAKWFASDPELEKQLKKSKEQIARILAALSDDARTDLQAQGII